MAGVVTMDLAKMTKMFSISEFAKRINRSAASLEQWFNTARPISDEEADLTEAQLIMQSLKDGFNPDALGCKKRVYAMRQAVSAHNTNLANMGL